MTEYCLSYSKLINNPAVNQCCEQWWCELWMYQGSLWQLAPVNQGNNVCLLADEERNSVMDLYYRDTHCIDHQTSGQLIMDSLLNNFHLCSYGEPAWMGEWVMFEGERFYSLCTLLSIFDAIVDLIHLGDRIVFWVPRTWNPDVWCLPAPYDMNLNSLSLQKRLMMNNWIVRLVIIFSVHHSQWRGWNMTNI